MKLLDKTMTAVLLGGEVSHDVLRKHAVHLTGKRSMRGIVSELGASRQFPELAKCDSGVLAMRDPVQGCA
jgi:hypothetical protein